MYSSIGCPISHYDIFFASRRENNCWKYDSDLLAVNQKRGKDWVTGRSGFRISGIDDRAFHTSSDPSPSRLSCSIWTIRSCWLFQKATFDRCGNWHGRKILLSLHFRNSLLFIIRSSWNKSCPVFNYL